MLKRLYLQNFALIDQLEIEFGSGLNVLTGETGAGKSIIVGAIARVLGAIVSKDDIRSGFDSSLIEADFDISNRKDISCEIDNLGIKNNKKTITLRREIYLNKASRSFMNNQTVTLAQLRPIATLIGELHGQHSHQLLLDEKNHLGFLDNFAGLTNDVERLGIMYAEWDRTRKELNRLISRRDQAKRERELLNFQKKEIEKANIRVGEEEELLQEKKILDSSRMLFEKSSVILSLLDENEPTALEILGQAQKELGDMGGQDKNIVPLEDLLSQAVINIEELRRELDSYRSNIPDDPARQEEINMRLDEIFKLKKKYGNSEKLIHETLNKIDMELGQNIDVDHQIEIDRAKEQMTFDNYSKLAMQISTKRQKSSKALAAKVIKELAQLGMEKAKFQFEFSYEEDPEGIPLNKIRVKLSPDGLEQGRFMVSANPGEPLKPLSKTASGGEISRIMLAIKSAERDKSKSSFLVFDEVDSGIGGQTARGVAKKLTELAEIHQLLIITHLHQIAEYGDQHYAVHKVSDSPEGRRTVTIKKLSEAEKKIEIKRMLALPAEP